MKKLILLLMFFTASQTIKAGVYRHDIDAQKYKDMAAQKQFDCAGVVIHSSQNSIGGSCVLVGDRYVLSAAHVFIKNEFRRDTVYNNGKRTIYFIPVSEKVDEVSEYTFRFNRQQRYGKSITIFPAYLDSATKGYCDLALIELDEPVKDIEPAKLNSVYDELGIEAIGVGWGASGKANEPENVGIWFEEIAGQNVIDSIGGYAFHGKPTMMYADMDKVGDATCNIMGSDKPTPLEYVTSGGDSGGGLFRNTKDGWELIGICTGAGVDITRLMKTGYYGQTNGWTRVSVFKDWIRSTMESMQQKAAMQKKK